LANAFTTLGFIKPEVGADTNLWGGHLNTNADLADAILERFVGTTTTHLLQFNVAAVSTTTTRTVTWIDADVTVGATGTSSTTFLTSSDLGVPTANTFINGPNTGSIGASGQKFAISAGGVYLNSSGGNMTAAFRISDGSQDIGDCCFSLSTGFAASAVVGPVVVTLTGATTFTLQATDNVGSNNGILKKTAPFSGAGTGLATWITAVRLS
jgi:hypothetical protein